ncbi:MAG: hypothetical protein JNJ73_11470 [Hyphomonadaceae bacterium]|nr:hypothetical protein [Hyphomonadaceae bacterium]
MAMQARLAPSSAFERLRPPSGRGALYVRRAFASHRLRPRDLYVWTPDVAPGAHLPVVYMQDGQNLFDARLVPFGAAWNLDECVSRLADQGEIHPAIIVGIGCTDDRLLEYAPDLIMRRLPARSRELIEQAWGGPSLSARYAHMLVEEIKPLIDAWFPTRPGRETTHIAGASLGGAVAAEMLARYPDVFASAACLSAHLSFLPIDEAHLPPPFLASDVIDAVGAFARTDMPRAGRHRVWLDRSEFGIDKFYEPAHAAFAAALSELGYVASVDLSGGAFAGVGHDESAWGARFGAALTFMFDRQAQPARV